MSTFAASIDLSGLQSKVAGAEAVFVRTLDRFVGRAAGETGREMKLQAPKAFTTLTNSVTTQRDGAANYSVYPKVNYAAAVNNGSKPHKPPLMPLMLWLKTVKRVSDKRELYRRARGLQRYIAAHGTRANPFVARTAERTHERALQLMRQGTTEAAREAFGQ